MMKSSRRTFIRTSLASATGLSALSMFSQDIFSREGYNNSTPVEVILKPQERPAPANSIRFSVIGLNHSHIYGMTNALIRGGGKLVSVYAREPELLAGFTKRYPNVKVAGSEEEILGDDSVQLVASASIPVDRAPLGIRVMKAGKDFMADKPGIVTLSQFKEVKKVQEQTKRIYSIMYSERLGNPVSVKADELIRSGAIGRVIQTIGLGPHRMNPSTRPDWFFDPGRQEGYFAISDRTSATSSCSIPDQPKRKWHFPRSATSIRSVILPTRISAI